MELLPADLSWTKNGPTSRRFKDIYFSADDGRAETEHVFIRPNRIRERLAETDYLTVGETGFGTGLNLLSVLALWRGLPEPRPRLHYITTELHPLSMRDLEAAHKAWPDLADLSQILRQLYPPAVVGGHRRWMFDGAVCLDFLWGDAEQELKAYEPVGGVCVDCWFLDGFSPALNPGMWTQGLLDAVAGLSGPGTSLSTFTVAGVVRKGLDAAGFKVEKAPGFGRKRDMLTAEYVTAVPVSEQTPNRKMTVIGGGIAGVSAAWQMSMRGYDVTVLEAGATICSGASGSPASAFTPFLQPEWSPRPRMLTSGFYTARHIFEVLRGRGHDIAGRQDGMLMLDMPDTSPRCARFSEWQSSLDLPETVRLRLTAQEMSEQAGVQLSCPGWLYPQAGWVNLPNLAAAMLADAQGRIETRFNRRVTAMDHDGRQWRLHCQSEEGAVETVCAGKVVVACAAAAAELLPELNLNKVHGQILSFIAPPDLAGLQRPLNCGHSLLPHGDGRLSWGASFRHKIETAETLPEETDKLLKDLEQCFGHRLDADSADLRVWAGLRCTQPSRMPMIGAVAGRPDGLYVHLAHGARGSLTAALMMPESLYGA
ncbi:MAG: tRNA (5-methylaminomethyl-2-thiouridine)(34)-methyltransferase MnmD [Parvibaculales bacterium]